MSSFTIRGIPILFPFEPYDIQKEYMEKVIECLQNETNGVLESPTGTGKTLSLLCASLAWLKVKKAQIQGNRYVQVPNTVIKNDDDDGFLTKLQDRIDQAVGNATYKGFLNIPSIIYASRTHSQLSQAMQELKRTGYSDMKATVIGSREQLCLHPDVIKEENNSTKIHICRTKLQTRSCHFYNRVEKMSQNPVIAELSVVDIEDIVRYGKELKFCPYYMAKELKQTSDIIFMPYNYLLDPGIRKSLNIELSNNVVILDEAHNIEKICEDSASLKISSTDITLCITEVTDIMKLLTDPTNMNFNNDSPKDFSPENLCMLKQKLLDLEKVIDRLEMKPSPSMEGTTFEGDYIFDILKEAGIETNNSHFIINLVDRLAQYLATIHQEGTFQRRGVGLELFGSLLKIVFTSLDSNFRMKIKNAFKLYLTGDEVNKKTKTWLSKSSTKTSKMDGKVLNFWCFNPGFGMSMLTGLGIRSVILTSGTLAPLKPLISELNLSVQVQLENPHVIKQNQIFVKILNKGPDGIELNSNFQNRNNPQYISSLGRTILNLSRIIPNGLLIFFPSYPIMQKCQQQWQEEGLWTNICNIKTIYAEPKQKEAFNTAMTNYYARVNDPKYRGAIFMGVCRGKISEGLDFADGNGRAVLITGLPYAPFKDPKVMLKRAYLESNRRENHDIISGEQWYTLDACRAVNQAVGRVIRHQHDYGAIILLDSRFVNFRIKSQLSMWLRDYIKPVESFGELIKNLRGFYRNAETNLPTPKPKVFNQPAELNAPNTYQKTGNFDFSCTSSCATLNNTADLVNIHKQSLKRKRIVIIPNCTNATQISDLCTNDDVTKEYILMVKNKLKPEDFKVFVEALGLYRDTNNFDALTVKLNSIFLDKYNLRYIIHGLSGYIKDNHKTKFEEYCETMN